MSGAAGSSLGEVLAVLAVDGATVATYVDGTGLAPTYGPRPFLHPVVTRAGTVTTDVVPDDHRWHNGVSVAVQDVDGTNLWGGRTYVRDEGYTWREDHGTITHEGLVEVSGEHLVAQTAWRRPDGVVLVHERRSLRVRVLPGADGAVALDVEFTLATAGDRSVPLGSPATNGRTGAGYGGFFWRLPRAAGPSEVSAPGLSGEPAVHGSTARWVAYRGDDDDADRPFTVVLHARDASTAQDPWFVRLEGYPGLGSMLAPEHPLVLLPDAPQTRRFSALVLDGHVDDDRVEDLVLAMAGPPGGFGGPRPAAVPSRRTDA